MSSRVKSKKKAKKDTVKLPKVTEVGELVEGCSEDLLVRHKLKQLTSWFHTWPSWQRRILICTLMNCSTKQQLAMLATSLEPTLHLDFTSSLVPSMQALHMDGVAQFHVQRAVNQRLVEPEMIANVDSHAYLTSIPSTLLSNSSQESHQSVPRSPLTKSFYSPPPPPPPQKKKREPILPALPLIHPDHLPNPGLNRDVSFTQLLGRQRYNSVPDYRSLTDLMKKYGERWGVGEWGGKPRRKSKTFGSLLSPSQVQPWQKQRAQMFKEQLAQVTAWMNRWRGKYKSLLLSEVVKQCDEGLLSYFVQCLYQQLQEKIDINSLPDSILQRIFYLLPPKDLCRASQVCRRWNGCANLSPIWKSCAYRLGMSEGVGNIVEVMETVIHHYKHSLSGELEEEGSTVDWKRVYRDLQKLIENMKHLIIQSVEAKRTAQSRLEDRLKGTSSKYQAQGLLSLVEMLEILRFSSSKLNATTQQLYELAPESATAMRRRLRLEKKMSDPNEEAIAEESKILQSSSVTSSRPTSYKLSAKDKEYQPTDTWTPTRNLEFARHLMMSIKAHMPSDYENLLKNYSLFDDEEKLRSKHYIEKLEIALDTRPRAPTLPNPNAVTCLVLAGGLLSSRSSRPGRIVNIPRIRRLENISSVALCIQCDARKIIFGCMDRVIRVIDVRSGRPVASLLGHKGSIQCLQFDDYKIVSGSWDTSVIVWDVVHLKMLRQLNGHMECVSCLQFDENILVTGSHDASLRVWSTASWEILSIMSVAHPGGILCLKMSDGIIASGGVDSKVKIWSAKSYQCLKTLHHEAPITALALSHLLLIVCCMEGAIIQWNLHSYVPVSKMHTKSGAYMKQLESLQAKYYAASSDGTVYELDLSTGTCLRTLKGHNRIVTAISVMDTKLVSTSADRTIVTWHFRKGFEWLDSSDVTELGEPDRGELDGEKKPEGEGEGEEVRRRSTVLTGELLFSDAQIAAKAYQYKKTKFYADFPLRNIVEEGTDWCGLVYDY